MCFLLGIIMMEIRKSSDLELTFEIQFVTIFYYCLLFLFF